MLFDTAMESAYGVGGDYESTLESYCAENYNSESEIEFVSENAEYVMADILKEGCSEIDEAMCALYISDIMVESLIVDGRMDKEKAENVLESGFKGFITNVKNKFKALWKKIQNWFSNVFKKIKVTLMGGKKFVSKYKEEITRKLKTSKLVVNCYNYQATSDTLFKFRNYIDTTITSVSSKITNTAFVEKIREESILTTKKFWEDCSYGKSWSDVRNTIINEYRGGVSGTKQDRSISSLDTDMLLRIACTDNIASDIKKSYEALKTKYDNVIKTLETIEKGNGGEAPANAKVVTMSISTIKELMSVLTDCQSVQIKMAQEKLRFAISLFKRVVKGKEAASSAAKESSEFSIFDAAYGLF